MAKLKVLGGDFAHHSQSSYFLGVFSLFEVADDKKLRLVSLDLNHAVQLKFFAPKGAMSVAGRSASGVVNGALVGGLAAGPAGAVAGAVLGAASGATAAKVTNKIADGPRRFAVVFDDGRRLEAELDAEEVKDGTLDRMKAAFEAKNDRRIENVEYSDTSISDAPMHTSGEDIVRSRLKAIENLRRDGSLTEAEYAQKRAEIIAAL